MQKGFKNLSIREKEVAVLVAKGLSNKEVANQLFVTEKTVKFHLTNIYKKMGLVSRAKLIVDAIVNKWAGELTAEVSGAEPEVSQVIAPQDIDVSETILPVGK
ncbi:MAG: helix-turn-helix transcriptional regulator [Bdellovibrio sp.]|nr:helix-turn-helix transcriptional regulator [Bdellovibrio sp.]